PALTELARRQTPAILVLHRLGRTLKFTKRSDLGLRMCTRIAHIQPVDIVTKRIGYILLRYFDTYPLRIQLSIVDIIQHLHLYHLFRRHPLPPSRAIKYRLMIGDIANPPPDTIRLMRIPTRTKHIRRL